MPQNGYWIECIPVTNGDLIKNNMVEDCKGYSASIATIPEAKVTAESPDKAIQLLRDKLTSLRHRYCTEGRTLPAHDSPIIPPRGRCNINGWISVYVQMAECCQTRQNH